MNTWVEDNQAIDMRLDEPWVAAFWNQSSAEPFRWESINATWQALSGKSCPQSTMYIEHWNMKASSFPRLDLSNRLGFLGLTWDLGSESAGGAGGVGGTESVARWSVMARSMSVNWLWYW